MTDQMYTDPGGYSLAPAGGWWTRDSGVAEYTQNDREKEDTIEYSIRNRFRGRPYNQLLLGGAIREFGDPHFLIPTNEGAGILIVFDILLGVNPRDGWVRFILRDKGECKRVIVDTAWEYVTLAAASEDERRRRWGHDEYQVYCTDEWPSEQCVIEQFGKRRFLGSEIRRLLGSERHAMPRNKQVKQELRLLVADPVSYLADHIAEAAKEREAAKQREADRERDRETQEKLDAERRKKEEERQERNRIFLMHKAIVDEKRTIKTDEEIDTMITENEERLQEEMQKPVHVRDHALIEKLQWLRKWHRDWRIHPQDIGFKYTHGVQCPRPQDFFVAGSSYYRTKPVFLQSVHIGNDLREAYRALGIDPPPGEAVESFMMDDMGERSNWHGEDIQEIYAENVKSYNRRPQVRHARKILEEKYKQGQKK